MTLKEFYTMICDEFNGGKNLEYKWTRKDGYWKMTKGQAWNQRFISKNLDQFIKEEKEMKKSKEKVPGKKNKKPYIKYREG